VNIDNHLRLYEYLEERNELHKVKSMFLVWND